MAYDFHYTPTGTGVISGKEVLEQTEDAINDLGNTAISGVQEALDKAEQALTNSENAVDDAQTALNTANNAEGVAIQAQTDVGNLSGTVTNIGNRVTTAEGNITNLQGRMTTAEGNITNLQGRMTTAETNIGNLQTAVSTAQATANSAQQTATTARQQSYVFRYSGTAVVPNSTIAYSTIDNTDNIKAGDKILDVDGKLFEITAVDTTNQTVTVGSALVDLALDANVVHTSGNETVGGSKTFDSNTYIYNSDNTATTPNLYLKSSKIEVSSQGNTPGDQNLAYADKNGTTYAHIKGAIQSNGSAVKIRSIAKDSSDNSVINELQILANTNGNKAIFPSYSNEIDLGLSSYKWKSFNGLTPSSLSLPADSYIDISGYVTDLTGGNNQYIAPANGWIYVDSNTSISSVIINNTRGYSTGFIFTGQLGRQRNTLPVCKDDQILINVNCTGLNAVRFIPCQGNV